MRTAHVEDPDLAGLDSPAELVEHERLRPRDRLAHRGRLHIDELGLEVTDSLALGQPVHPEDGSVRKEPPEPVVEVRREARRGIGHAPHTRIIAHLLESEKGCPRRRDSGEHRHRLVPDPLERPDREDERALEDERRPEPDGQEQLVEPVREGEGQDVQDPILAVEPQVRGDAPDAEDERLMGHHHPLRDAGRARGVDERGEVVRDRLRISDDRLGRVERGFRGRLRALVGPRARAAARPWRSPPGAPRRRAPRPRCRRGRTRASRPSSADSRRRRRRRRATSRRSPSRTSSCCRGRGRRDRRARGRCPGGRARSGERDRGARRSSTRRALRGRPFASERLWPPR